jgi:hypothetical protein
LPRWPQAGFHKQLLNPDKPDKPLPPRMGEEKGRTSLFPRYAGRETACPACPALPKNDPLLGGAPAARRARPVDGTGGPVVREPKGGRSLAPRESLARLSSPEHVCRQHVKGDGFRPWGPPVGPSSPPQSPIPRTAWQIHQRWDSTRGATAVGWSRLAQIQPACTDTMSLFLESS